MARFVFYDPPPDLAANAARLRADRAVVCMKLALARLMLALKYNPDQPRVPAGNPYGGQWTDGDSLTKIATSDSGEPPRVIAVPMYGTDPLDPKELNIPPSPTDLRDIEDTLTKLKRGKPSDLSQLAPKDYKNYPDKSTGAVLPPSVAGYTSFAVGSRSGARRLIIDSATGATYYTNNHYRSFYHVQ